MLLHSKRQIILLTFLLFAIVLTKASPTKQNNKTALVTIQNQSVGNLSNSYNELLNDVRWFFQRIEDFSSIALTILPNIGLSEETRTFSESTRLNLLFGMRHLFIGIREMSITLRKSVEAEHMRQFQYVIQASNIIHEALKTLKVWFGNLRTLLAQLYRVYSQRLPEVLLGKCLVRYVAVTHPERPYYEYPLLLFTEIFNALLESRGTTQVVASPVEIEMEVERDEKISLPQTTTETVSIEQNEIPYGRAMTNVDEDYVSSFFNLSDVIDEDKDSVIDSAVKNHSWKKCFKMYTAETIVRKLKVYFLEMA